MIVFSAGVPRSGTVLINAILRALYRHAGLAVTVANPHGAELPVLMSELLKSGRERRAFTLIHTHSWDPQSAEMVAGSVWTTGFLNRRDPRDVCVSLMALHDVAFDVAVTMVHLAFEDFRLTRDATAWPVIDYGDLVADKIRHIHLIAGHLGIDIDSETAKKIDDATSMEKHRAIMQRVQDGTIEHLVHRNNSQRVLREDAASLINDRHIQSGETGRWRSELTPDQRAAVNDVFADILEDIRSDRAG